MGYEQRLVDYLLFCDPVTRFASVLLVAHVPL